jgi:hypothetical protein
MRCVRLLRILPEVHVLHALCAADTLPLLHPVRGLLRMLSLHAVSFLPGLPALRRERPLRRERVRRSVGRLHALYVSFRLCRPVRTRLLHP